MHLPFELIHYHLSQNWSLHISPAKDFYPDVCLPFLYSASAPLEKGTLIVTDASHISDLPLLEENHYVVFCGQDPQNACSHNGVWIYIDSPVYPCEVLNCILQCFLEYQVWDEQAKQILNENKSLQELLNISSLYFKNRLDVTDGSHSLIAGAQSGKPESSKSRPTAFSYSKMTPQRFSEYQQKYLQLRRQKKAFIWREDATTSNTSQFPTLCINLFDGDVFIGALTLTPTLNPLHPHDLMLLERLAPYVQQIYLRDINQMDSSHIVLLRDHLRSLVNGEPPSIQLLSHLGGMADYTSKYSFRCMTINLPSESWLNFGKYLRKEILSLQPDSILFTYDTCLVMIIKEHLCTDDFLDKLLSLLNRMQLSLGISDSFSDLSVLRYYYLEARFVLSQVLLDSIVSSFGYYSDFKYEYLLMHCSGDLPKDLLFPDGLKRVLEYDKNTSVVSYQDTLRAYLDADRNAARTARDLHISRNAFLTRLEKLESLLEMDLDNPDNRLLLSICLRLYQL